MSDVYNAFATGKTTAKDDLIRAVTDVVCSKQTDAEKVAAAKVLLAESLAGARARRKEFDLEVD